MNVKKSWKPWFDERVSYRGSRSLGENCDAEPHPIRHISALQCHEWMLRECASLNQARQQREDGIVSTVATISSTALLAIPGLLLTKGLEFPSFQDGWQLYIGIACFGLALVLAMTEQILSVKAHHTQISITQAYYRLESQEQADNKSIARVNRARIACIAVFAIAVGFSAFGLSQVRSAKNGQSTAPASSSTPAASTPAASTPTAAASTAAAPADAGRGLRQLSAISAGSSSSASSEAEVTDPFRIEVD